MTDLSSSLQIILQEAGYQTWLSPAGRFTAVCFEDETVVGFASTFEDVVTLLGEWRAIETICLTRFAPRLREAKDKAWNVYSLFLAAGAGDDHQVGELRRLEENLELTRKIAACGLNDREELINAILPILPLQYQPRLDRENLTERLRSRIATIAPAAAQVALDDNVQPSEVVAILGGEK
jgi:hypothetical protein